MIFALKSIDNPLELEDPCCICLAESKTEMVGHAGEDSSGRLYHAVHKDCLKQWCKSQNLPYTLSIACVTCQKQMDAHSLFSSVERTIGLARIFLKNAVFGAIGGEVVLALLAAAKEFEEISIAPRVIITIEIVVPIAWILWEEIRKPACQAVVAGAITAMASTFFLGSYWIGMIGISGLAAGSLGARIALPR